MADPTRLEQAVRRQLERILSSPEFARNERLSRFLRFVVERRLEGRDDEVKETLIAVEVFGRRPDYDPKQDSIVRTEAARLRARLHEYYFEGAGREDALVLEVPKGGYLPTVRQREFRAAESTRPVRTMRWAAALAVLAAAAGAVTLLTMWWSPSASSPIRLAVLPLETLGADSAPSAFADGLTDEIIRSLSVIEGLDVRSRTSSFAFKGRPRNIRETARELDVDYVLEGSVLTADGRLRINAQLIRASDDRPVWSERFDRAFVDVLATQDEISLGIVNNLRLELGRGRRRYETSAQAYELYLRARANAVALGGPGRPESIELFEQALAVDPRLAPAWAGLGAEYAFASANFAVPPPPNALEKMKEAAARAIAIDPLLAEAHSTLALAHAREGRWDDAEKGFRRAIELDPGRSASRVDFAVWHLHVLGRTEEALAQLRAALGTDPLSAAVHAPLASVLITFGRYDEAMEYCRRLPDSHQLRVQCLGRVALGQGRLDEAIEVFARDADLAEDPQARGFLGYAYARAGRRQEAEAMVMRSTYANEQALIFAGLGDTERAIEALDRMTAVGGQRLGRYPEVSRAVCPARRPAAGLRSP